MKTIRPLIYPAIAAALMCLALNAAALTVGRLKGSALLGQPLEVVASVQLARDEDPAAVCLEAAVAYGDVPQSAGQTVVKVVPGPQEQTVFALITSSAPVNEPVVTVDLKAGCNQKTTRRFVLLADVSSESQPIGKVPAATSAPPAVQRAPASVSSAAAAPASAGVTVNSPVAKPVTKAPRTESKPAAVEKRAAAAVAPSPASALSTEAVDDLKRRIEAVAQWQAEKASAREAQVPGESIDVLQENLKALQVVTIKNQNSIQAVAQALEASEGQRVAPSLLYGLFGLVFASIAALGYFFFSTRFGGQSSTPWWGTSINLPAQATADDAAVQAVAIKTQQLPATINPIGASANASAGGVDIELGESAFAGLPTAVAKDQTAKSAAPCRSDKRDFAASGSATLRAINTKEMFDVRQQAEFFMALGQHDEAIKVLERSNSETEESNPLVLLDLLKILHTLSRRADFDRYRAEFNAVFTGMVPVYTNFLDEGKSLESYTDIVQQISDLWPSDDAMDYIEQCMVRTPEDDPSQGFSLAAFRDLLVLHGTLRRLDTDVDSTLAPFSANRTMGAALSADAGESAFAPYGEGNSDLAPLPVLPDEAAAAADPQGVDLDLTDNNGTNLMDFDINGIGGAEKPKS